MKLFSRIAVVTFLVMVLGWMGSVEQTEAAAQMEDLENALMCKCDDECGKVMINCTCSTSKETRKDFAAKLASGLTVDQVIQIYVDKYGETVLSAPTKTGFNLTAWVTPFVALVIGGFGVRKVILKWMGKDPDDSDDPQSGPKSGLDSKNSDRLKNELDKLEDWE